MLKTPALSTRRLVDATATEIRDLADSLMFLAEIVKPSGTPDEAQRGPADPPILLT